MANARTKAKIEARIKERAAYCVEFELNDPRSAFITITKVEVSSDLGSARIFYSVYGSQGDRNRCARMLEDASGFVRRQVGRVLKMRRIPRLTWIYDDSIEYAARMDATIAQALKRDREINPEAHPEFVEPEGDAEGQVEREYLDYLQAQEDEDPDDDKR